MSNETQPAVGRPHKPRHLAERFEKMIGVVMVVAIALLAVGFIYGVMTTGAADPKWMQ